MFVGVRPRVALVAACLLATFGPQIPTTLAQSLAGGKSASSGDVLGTIPGDDWVRRPGARLRG